MRAETVKPVRWIIAGGALHALAARSGRQTLCRRHGIADMRADFCTSLDVEPEALVCVACRAIVKLTCVMESRAKEAKG